MQMKLLSIAAAVALAFAGAAQAQQKQDTTRQDRPAASNPGPDRATSGERRANEAKEDRIEANAKAAKAKCDGMKGQEKDLCEQQAKSQEKVRKAELAAQKDPSPRNQRKLEETKAEAEYEVAKAKCDVQGGKADNACKKEAKAQYDKAKADIKGKYAKADAKRDRTSDAGTAGTGATRGDNTPNRDLNRNGR